MLNKEEVEERISFAKSSFTDGAEIFLEIIEKLEQENNKQNKIIELMSEQLAGIAIWNSEKQEPLILGDKEDVKQYFEKKVEDK